MATDNPRRLWATACLALAATFVVPLTPAHAEPSPAEVQKKITKLNEQVDQLVEKYNKVNEDLKAAKVKYVSARKTANAEKKDYNALRGKIAEMAAAAYKTGELGDVPAFLSSDDPQKVLDQTALLTQLSRDRNSQLNVYLASAQRVEREEAQAKEAYAQVAAKAKEMRDQKATVEKSIAKQRALLARIGGGTSTGGGSTGGTYNGPATGNARKALDFAYAQLGKPYSYGAAGPGSFDCSGLTMRAWEAAGVSITRTTNTQYNATRRVAYADLQPGDLVFFSSLGHVGLYAGGGKMVHAPRTGDVVKVVDITSGYYRSNFYGAGRP